MPRVFRLFGVIAFKTSPDSVFAITIRHTGFTVAQGQPFSLDLWRSAENFHCVSVPSLHARRVNENTSAQLIRPFISGVIRALTPVDFVAKSIHRGCERDSVGNTCVMDHSNMAMTCFSTCVSGKCQSQCDFLAQPSGASKPRSSNRKAKFGS